MPRDANDALREEGIEATRAAFDIANAAPDREVRANGGAKASPMPNSAQAIKVGIEAERSLMPASGSENVQQITATPFEWIDPATIPPRRFIYGTHLIRKYASATIAPGGVGKSTLLTAEALAIVTGEPILGITPKETCAVWAYNGEDPRDELQRRYAAAIIAHKLRPPNVQGRFYMNSGRDQPICIAEMEKGAIRIAIPIENALVERLLLLQIGVLQVDPFISFHRLSENDNTAIDAVTKTWARIADRANCAIDLVHHVRKVGDTEVSVDDARGASALISAVRSARVLNRMTKDEAAKAGVDSPRPYFRTNSGKVNLSPSCEESEWYEIRSLALNNGDDVGVAHRWKWPSPFAEVSLSDLETVQKKISEGQWRENIRATDWAGKAVAEVLGIDLQAPGARAQVKSILDVWVKNRALKTVEKKDASRKLRRYVEAGEWVS